jgi:hypothetical protein
MSFLPLGIPAFSGMTKGAGMTKGMEELLL